MHLQLWQATGFNLQRQVVRREAYFPELSAPAAVHKQLPPDGLETGQQKRAKLWNGQYRSRAAAPAGLHAADTPQPVGVAHKQQHSRHVTPGLAAAVAAAAAAGQQRQQHNSVLASPSSSSSHDSAGYGPRRPSCGSAAEPAALRSLTVPWPVSIKGRRNSRQRRSNWAQWTAILHAGAGSCAAPAASTVGGSAPAAAACPAVDAMDVEQHTAADGVQQLPELEHQQSGVLQDGQLQQEQQQHSQPAHQQAVMQPRPLRPLQAIVQQQQHGEHGAKQQQKEAAALLQQMAPATPSHIKLSRTAFAAVSGAPGVAGKQHAAEIAAAAGGDGSLHETSTSSEQTHDGMNDSPRDPIREPLSSWPSSSTDSVCQLQQQQQFLLLLQQQGKVGSGVQRKAALAAVDGGWGSPGSPLPATAI